MGAARDGGFVALGGELGEDEEVDLEKPGSHVPSKLLDGGAESSTCGICSIFVQTRGLLDCCHHLFCFSCITEWFTVSNLCPLCKSRSRFITPQMLSSDTGCWERLGSGDGSVSRDEGPSDEDGHPVSFPPYFIDEEAVICLEGDACLVRAGLLDFDAEGNAASDTSVACDLCDCWYHGGCVNFQPDQSSFHCPRCLASKEKDGTSVDASKLLTVAFSEEKTSSAVTSLHIENQSAYGAQTMFGISSVAIEDPEEGESHVSISLRRIPDGQPVKAQLTVEDSEREIVWSPIREPFAVPTYGAAWSRAPEPARRSQHVNEVFPSSAREPTRNVPYFEEELWSPTREPSGKVPQFEEELWSPTRETGNDLSLVGARSKLNAASAKVLRAANSQRPESRCLLNAAGPRAVVTPGPELLNNSARVERHPAAVKKIRNASEVCSGMLPINSSNNIVQPVGLIKGEISIDVDRLQVAVEQLRKGKRKVLQEDERNIDFKDLPEMPRKIARKSTRKVDGVDDKSPSATKDIAKKVTTDLIVGEQTDVQDVSSLAPMIEVDALDDKTVVASEDIQKRVATDVVVGDETDVQLVNIVEPNIKTEVDGRKDILKVATDVVAGEQIDTHRLRSLDDSAVKTEPIEVSYKEQLATPHSERPTAPEKKVEVSSLEVCSEVDVMDIVSDQRGCLVKDTSTKSGPSKGVRTRIIMHREPDIKDSERPSLVERIRQQMRDTAGYGAGDDLGKVEVSDDRFIAAFKAAQTRSYEKSKEVKLSSSRQQSSGRLWKVLDKKYNGTGVRDNLTRKLYAGGGRKCWDRDWDISFWRERDPHQRRARKDAEDGSGKMDARATDMQPDSEDADFFNRLYMADTSLFPRNEDVKPLSEQANHAEGTGAPELERNRTGKVPHPHLDSVNTTHGGVKDTAQQSPLVQGVSAIDKLSKMSHNAKVVDPPPSKIVKKSLKPSAVSKETSLNAKTSSGSGKSAGGPSTAPKAQSKDTEATPAVGDVKKDKRQWALEILARKEGKLSNSSASGKTGGSGSVTKDNPFHLLLQLPVEMRPLILGDSRRSKVPPAVRQVQLNRFVEQELRRANLAVIEKSSECADAIARAVSREEELCKSSNSKGVYINRCVRALANTDYEVKAVETSPCEGHDNSEARSEESSRPEEDEAVRKALEDTGLMDSPATDPASASEHDADGKEDSLDITFKISDTNGGSKIPRPAENKWVENVLEVENADLDIYGDFEFNSDDDLDATLSKENPQRLKHIPATSVHSSDGKAKSGSLMVVLTTGSCPSDAALESGEAEVPAKKLSNKQPIEGRGGGLSCSEDGDLRTSISPTVEAVTCGPTVEPSFDDADDMYDNLELNLNPVLSNEVMAQLRAEPSGESKETHEELKTLPATIVNLKKRKESESLLEGDAAASENISEDDCLKFADIDRRIENIRRSKALNGDPQRSKKSKGRVHGEAKRTSENNVQMQVEIYVNQHLKPLYRSQVISAEQFKWTVSKTAAKVMEHHGNAVSADFLISEGSKVKKLADQYLQTFVHRKT